MKNKNFLVSVIVFIVLAVSIVAGVILVRQEQDIEEKAAPASSLLFNPQAVSVVRGGNFVSNSKISTGTNKITGIDIEITYNPAVIRLNQVTPTSALANFSSVIRNDIDNTAGKARYIAYVLDRNLGIIGDFDILTLSGTVLSNSSAGSYQITYSSLTTLAALNESQNVLTTKSPLTVTVTVPTATPTVSPSPSPTPTASPSPTASPTPTPVRTITVTSPNGGESFVYGNPFSVTWNSTQNFGNVDVILEQVNSGGNPTASMISINHADDGSLTWTEFPNTLTYPGNFRIRVQARDNVMYANVFDRSNSNFTINMPTPSPTPTRSPSPTPSASPTPSPTPSPSPIVYPNWDVDQNGVINIVDIGLVVDQYGNTNPTVARADVDRNGIVNIVDIGIIIDHYN